MGFLDPVPTLPKHKKTIAQKIFYVVLVILGGIFLLWSSIFLATPCGAGVTLAEWLAALKKQQPFEISWNKYTPAFLLGLTSVTVLVILYYACEPNNYRHGIEHGSSRIAVVEDYNKELEDKKEPEKNLILTQNIRLAIRTSIHRRNLNILLIAGSGKGKTYNVLGPNLMSNLPMSYIITDPKKEVLTKYGKMLKEMGYRIKVIDLMDFEGDHYNPMAYIHTERELVRQVTLFLKNTTPKDAKSDVPFWEKAENTLWMGLFFYVWIEFEDDPSRRNFCTVIDLLSKAVSTETDEKGNPLPSELQEIILDLEQRDPNHPAVRQLKRVLFGAPDTVNSIIQMAQARAASLDIEEVRDFLSTDTLDIPSLGFGTNYDGKTRTAVFLCVPEDDPSYNFLAAMVVDQMTQELKNRTRGIHLHQVHDRTDLFKCSGLCRIYDGFYGDEYFLHKLLRIFRYECVIRVCGNSHVGGVDDCLYGILLCDRLYRRPLDAEGVRIVRESSTCQAIRPAVTAERVKEEAEGSF